MIWAGLMAFFPTPTYELQLSLTEPYAFTVAGAQNLSNASVRFLAIISAD